MRQERWHGQPLDERPALDALAEGKVRREEAQRVPHQVEDVAVRADAVDLLLGPLHHRRLEVRLLRLDREEATELELDGLAVVAFALPAAEERPSAAQAARRPAHEDVRGGLGALVLDADVARGDLGKVVGDEVRAAAGGPSDEERLDAGIGGGRAAAMLWLFLCAESPPAFAAAPIAVVVLVLDAARALDLAEEALHGAAGGPPPLLQIASRIAS